MGQTHLSPQWQQRLLALINSHGWDTGQFNPHAIALLTAWQNAEGGNADWNPLNTTQHIADWCGPDYNKAGVCNYLKPIYGLMATAATLVNGNYNGILGWLQDPQITAAQAVDKYAAEFRVWGTNPALIKACLTT